MAERLFTLQEALAALPSAAAVLLDIQRWKQELEDRSLELERLLDSTGDNATSSATSPMLGPTSNKPPASSSARSANWTPWASS